MPRVDARSDRRHHRGLPRLRGDAARPTRCPRHRHRTVRTQPPGGPRPRMDLYVHQRTLLERYARANLENVWNGRPISKIVPRRAAPRPRWKPVSNIELIPPVHQRVYKMGLEHLGVVVGDDIDNWSRVHRAALTGQQFQSATVEPYYVLFEDFTHVKFYRVVSSTAFISKGPDRRLRPRRQLGAAEPRHRHWPEPAAAVAKATARRRDRTLCECSGMSPEEAGRPCRLRSC